MYESILIYICQGNSLLFHCLLFLVDVDTPLYEFQPNEANSCFIDNNRMTLPHTILSVRLTHFTLNHNSLNKNFRTKLLADINPFCKTKEKIPRQMVPIKIFVVKIYFIHPLLM